jgi:V8-like Glu-specific endopeptidase
MSSIGVPSTASGVSGSREKGKLRIRKVAAGLLGGLALAASGCSGEAVYEDTVEVDDTLIFGTDDRLEHGQVIGTEYQYLANSTAALVDETAVNCAGGTCALTSTPWTMGKGFFGWQRLCNDVRFRGQPALAGCTGFLVAPDLIATAGHCTSFPAPSCTGTAIVFGYNADASGNNAPTSAPAANVYWCMSETKVFSGGDDWALLRLDRPVPRPVLNVRYGTPVTLNMELAVLGYPYGVPLKVSPTGQVTAVNSNTPQEFSHNIDSFGGNSGSPVFERLTGVVVGIHVRPPQYQDPEVPHWVSGTDANGGCLRERVCPTGGCPTFGYSEASRITRLAPQIPLSAALVGIVTG